VREQVVNHVIHAQVWEAQRTVVVVQLQRRDAGGVGLETEDEDVTHQAHVVGNVLGDGVGGAGHIWLFEGRTPALQLTFLAGVYDALLHVTDGFKILVEFLLIIGADIAAQIFRFERTASRTQASPLLTLSLNKRSKASAG